MAPSSTKRAGRSRRARRAQKARSRMVPDRVHSFIRSRVIRNPLRTKNTFTEMTPPAAQPKPPWLAMMPRIETARIPSRAGM